MLCQSCHKNTANTRIKTIVNGEVTEYALCSECAQKLGYNNLFGSFGNFGHFGNFDNDFFDGFGNLLGGFFGNEAADKSVTRCSKCGASFEDISRSGKVGCAECYKTFRNLLLPSIQRIHGTAHHRGKRPGSLAMQVVQKQEIVPTPPAEPKAKTPLEEKKEALQKAIQEQNFEQAAVLRDEIREMEGKQ